MSKFSDRYDGLEDGLSIVNIGAPGMGKSYFAGSVCEVVDPERVLLLVTKPREKSGWLYRKHGLTKRAIVFHDQGWNPSASKYVATAWKNLMTTLDNLYEDTDYDAIILDPGTDAIKLADHSLMAPHKVGSPGDLGDTRSYYRQLKDKSQEFVDKLVGLSISDLTKSPKHIIVTWHAQPPKEDINPNKASADQVGKGVEYEGKVLPMIEGSYRRKLAADFSCVAYADILPARRVMDKESKKLVQRDAEYVIQVIADADRHAKVADAPPMREKYLPNNFKALYDAVVRG